MADSHLRTLSNITGVGPRGIKEKIDDVTYWVGGVAGFSPQFFSAEKICILGGGSINLNFFLQKKAFWWVVLPLVDFFSTQFQGVCKRRNSGISGFSGSYHIWKLRLLFLIIKGGLVLFDEKTVENDY